MQGASDWLERHNGFIATGIGLSGCETLSLCARNQDSIGDVKSSGPTLSILSKRSLSMMYHYQRVLNPEKVELLKTCRRSQSRGRRSSIRM
jgi:hypothetical protein